jgi:hypothetical protein
VYVLRQNCRAAGWRRVNKIQSESFFVYNFGEKNILFFSKNQREGVGPSLAIKERKINRVLCNLKPVTWEIE